MELRIALLGPIEVQKSVSEELPRVILPSREQAVLALLALSAGRVVSASRLIDELWPDDPPNTAANTVQVYISHLRRSIGRETVRTVASGYLLDADLAWIDVTEFKFLAERGRDALQAGRYAEATQELQQALTLWRGEPFGGDAKLSSLAAEALRLTERRLLALEDWVEAVLESGSGRDVIAELQGQVAEHPLRERLQAGLMTALFQAGRQSEALDSFAGHRRRCVEELGIEPGPALRRLQADILAGDLTLMPAKAAAPPLLLPVERPPVPATRLMARERELVELAALVSGDARLVTVTGPGGVGKTRLLVECAHQLSSSFAGGVCWVPLVAITDGEELLPAIARGLGIQSDAGETLDESVRTVLMRQELLLVLDNMEHLLPVASKLVSTLLSSSPAVRLLVSSRIALHVDGEHRYPLEPLSTSPGSGTTPLSPAGELFVARARAVRPQFEVSPQNAPLINDVCVKLDGLPLALELVGARSNLLSLTSLHRRLEDRLSHAARPQTLRDTVAWSYDLLPSRLRRLFRQLSVFSGGADLDAIADVVAVGLSAPGTDVFDSIAELVDASLLTVIEDSEGEPRFTMLETIRAYAYEQLTSAGEAEMVQSRHARHFLVLAEQLNPLLDGEGYQTARKGFEVELGNFREALDWSVGVPRTRPTTADAMDSALRLCTALNPFWARTGNFAEGRRWLDRAVELADGVDSTLVAACLNHAANHAYKLGDIDRAHACATSSVAMWHRLGSIGARSAKALNSLAAIELERGNLDAVLPLYEQALQIARADGDRAHLADVLSDFAGFEASRNNFERCLEMDLEAVSIARELGDRVDVLLNQQNVACTLRQMGRLQEAQELMRELVPQILQYDVPASLTAVAEDFAAILAELGDHVAAVRLIGAADARRERLGTPRYALQQAEIAEPLSKSKAALSNGEWAEAYAAGHAATVEQALAEAVVDRAQERVPRGRP